MTSRPDEPTDKEAMAEGRRAQADVKVQSAREAMADYRARETAADDNADRLKTLRLTRDAEIAAEAADEPTAGPKARKATEIARPDEGLRPDQLTTENDG